MSLSTTYHAQHSIPNRSSTQRPRAVSLTEYQPLAFDREATQAAYQASLDLPASSVSSLSHHSSNSLSHYGGPNNSNTNTSVETGDTAQSTLSHHLKAGDNPHAELFRVRSAEPAFPAPPTNFAGVGAGHSLTPPDSPIHSAAASANRNSLLSPVLQSPRSPELHGEPSPMVISPTGAIMGGTNIVPPSPESPYFPSTSRMTRRASAMDVDQVNDEAYTSGDFSLQPGYEGEIQGGGGKRRALPTVPTDVPAPVPPRWEPDYKPQIPPELIAASAQNAYASLSAPPPNLPPRRNPQRSASRGKSYSSSRNNAIRNASGRVDGDDPMVGGSGSNNAYHGNGTRFMPPPLPSRSQSNMTASTGTTSSFNHASSAETARQRTPPLGAPDYPPANGVPVSTRPKRSCTIEQGIILTAPDDKGIWSTHYIDPCLRKPIANVPSQITNVTNSVLSGLASGPKTRFNQTTGAPIDGMAQMAKGWFVAPDAKFTSDRGGIELSLAVIDGSSEEEWGSDKGRKKARVEVTSRHGGIKVDLMEIEGNRQVDLKVESKTGDVLILLPDNFLGPIHITSPAKAPEFLPIISAQTRPVVQPYESFHTTFVLPLAYSRHQSHPFDGSTPHATEQDKKRKWNSNRGKGKTSSFEHTAMSKIAKFIPEDLLEQSDELDQAFGGYIAHTRGEQSKVSVTAGKGRVVFGYRESLDEERAKSTGLKVGVRDGKGKKGWFR